MDIIDDELVNGVLNTHCQEECCSLALDLGSFLVDTTDVRVHRYARGPAVIRYKNLVIEKCCKEKCCFLYPALALPYDNAYELKTECLQVDTNKILGQGQFGVVYKRVVMNSDKPLEESRTNAAVKTLKSFSSKDNVINFLYEIKVMICLGKHPNLVTMIGACTKTVKNKGIYLAMEFCDHGTLLSYLQNLKSILASPHPSLNLEHSNGVNSDPLSYVELTLAPSFSLSSSEYSSWPIRIDDQHIFDLFRWSYEIVCGMEYITRKKLVHGDLATRSVLLHRESNKLIAEISDFGLSRKLYKYAHCVKAEQNVLPWRWLPPETLRQLKFSIKSDVWSYGICLWEIFSFGEIPYGEYSYSMKFLDMLDKGLRNPKPKIATVKFCNVMMACWLHAEAERPRFQDIKLDYETMFGEDLGNVKYYLKEVRY